MTHPLAGCRSLTLADLDGEPVLDGRTRRTSSLEEKFELIASGQGIALVPVSIAGTYSRPGLVYRAVTDAPPVETCLAVPEDGCTGPSTGLPGHRHRAAAPALRRFGEGGGSRDHEPGGRAVN
ncbi:hypothetical protein [Streptomyces echinatus]|uniref:hypothetical protein n=1 Tax=Streptomyces echinatus TaxID=67293 RepID=UPI0031E5ACBB